MVNKFLIAVGAVRKLFLFSHLNRTTQSQTLLGNKSQHSIFSVHHFLYTVIHMLNSDQENILPKEFVLSARSFPIEMDIKPRALLVKILFGK